MLVPLKIMGMNAKQAEIELLDALRNYNMIKFNMVLDNCCCLRGLDLELVWRKAIEVNNSLAVIKLISIIQKMLDCDSVADVVVATIELNSEEYLRELLLINININLIDSHGTTPLQAAIESGNLILFDILLNCGADIEFRNSDGETPLMTAIRYSAWRNFIVLLELGADIHVKNDKGENCIFLAIFAKVEILEKLITLGCDVNYVSNRCETPLLFACKQIDKPHHAILLLEEGADVQFADKSGNTPLHKAAKGRHEGLIEALIVAGAEIDKVNCEDETPLIVAAKAGKRSIVEMLIRFNANINYIDKYKRNALLYSYESSFAGATKVLLKNGADLFYWPYEDPFLHTEKIHFSQNYKIGKFLCHPDNRSHYDKIHLPNLLYNNYHLFTIMDELEKMKKKHFWMGLTVFDVYTKPYIKLINFFRKENRIKSAIIKKIKQFNLHKDRLLYKLKKARGAYELRENQLSVIKLGSEETYFKYLDEQTLEKIAIMAITDNIFPQ